ncbi:NAD(P)-binding domain-containing protein [Myxococcota bacterium]|nr:NAD(P)-binding domain-containing protein [Myxococcota bacterium]
MKIGVMGTGDVGQALGKAFVTLGHEVLMGSRTAGNEKAAAWAKLMGPKACSGTFAEAARFGELIVLATLGAANEDAIRAAGIESFDGKIVIDTTNPLDFSKGMPPTLFAAGDDSGGERVQRLLPNARVVKAFNSVGHAHMFRPDFAGGPPDMFIGGNDKDAKVKVGALLGEFGWGVIDLGGIETSRYLEPLCLVWVLTAVGWGSWNHAFKMLRK